MRVIVTLLKTPFCVNGSPSENFFASARLPTLTTKQLPTASVPSSFCVAPASTRIFFWLPRYSRCGARTFSRIAAALGLSTQGMTQSMLVSSGRAHEIPLAEIDAVVAQDVVCGRDVEVEIRQRAVLEQIHAL